MDRTLERRHGVVYSSCSQCGWELERESAKAMRLAREAHDEECEGS